MPCNARTSHEIKIASADLASICIDRCIDQRSAAVCVRDRMMEKKPLHRCILLIVLLLLTEHKTAHGQGMIYVTITESKDSFTRAGSVFSILE